MIPQQPRFDRLEDEIEAMIADLEFYTYHQLLDVRPDARPEIVLYNFNVKVHEYRQIQADKRCTAALYQNIEFLIDRFDEAREVLCDRRLAAQYARGLDQGNMRHPRVAAVRDARRPKTEPLPIDNRVQDEALERRASQLEEQLQELIHAPDEEIEETSRGIDEQMLEQEAQQLAEEVNSYGVQLDNEDLVEEEELPIDAEFLEEIEGGLRQALLEDGVSDNEDAHLEEDQAPDAEYTQEAVQALQVELAADGVDLHAEEVEPDETPDLEYTEEAVRSLERELVEDGVFVHELVEDEDPLAAVDLGFASEAVDRLKRELSGDHGIVVTEASELAAAERARQKARPRTSDALKALSTVEDVSVPRLPGDPSGLDSVSTDPDPQRASSEALTTTEREVRSVRPPKNASEALEAAQATMATRRSAAAAKRTAAATAKRAAAATAKGAAEAASTAAAADTTAAAQSTGTVVDVDVPQQLIGRKPPRVWRRRGGTRPPLPLAPAADVDVGQPIALETRPAARVELPELPDLGEPIELS